MGNHRRMAGQELKRRPGARKESQRPERTEATEQEGLQWLIPLGLSAESASRWRSAREGRYHPLSVAVRDRTRPSTAVIHSLVGIRGIISKSVTSRPRCPALTWSRTSFRAAGGPTRTLSTDIQWQDNAPVTNQHHDERLSVGSWQPPSS